MLTTGLSRARDKDNNRYIRIHNSHIAPFQWIRTDRSNFDDIRTGYYRNEYLGWYRECTDPGAQGRAMDELGRQGIWWRDWAVK